MDKIQYFDKVAEYKLLAKHEVGQNFLIDFDVCEKIVSLLDIKEGDSVLEIGPGAGSLSFFISQNEGEADLVDIDEGLITKLKSDFAECNNVHPIFANALKWDVSKYTKVIGNLPYYITTSLIEYVLMNAKSSQKLVFMIQKESFTRINAKISSDMYGPLQILLEYRGTARREFNVPRTSFVPAPHVESTVFTISIKEDSDIEVAKELYSFTSKIFINRRKTILNNLGRVLNSSDKAREILSKVGVKENARPENISLKQYLALMEASKNA